MPKLADFFVHSTPSKDPVEIHTTLSRKLDIINAATLIGIYAPGTDEELSGKLQEYLH